MSTRVTLSSREEPCRLTSHSHPGRSPVDSRHTLIRGGAVSTRVTLSSGEEPCRLVSHSHPGRSRVDSRHTLIRGGAVSTHVTLSSREEPCRLTSHSHPGRSQWELHSYVLVSLAEMYMCMWRVLIVTQISSLYQDCHI